MLVLGSLVRGFCSQALWTAILACFLGVMTAHADDFVPTHTTPDTPPRENQPPRVPPPTWDLDGLYLWLGPSGAAGHLDSQWDSLWGADASVIEIREHAPLAAFGGSLGGARWTERGGGRIWLDALAGTRIAGRMMGASLGPLLELSDLAHPRVGASVGVWAFVGVTPYVRVGAVNDLGGFVEIGLHLALPVLRHRH
jgi:hypothetical protein